MAHVPDVNETKLLQDVYGGKPCKFDPNNKPYIDAPYLCEHILEIPAQASGNPGRAVRWEIHNAVFAGRFDLRDGCRAGGGSLPALEFVACEFQEGFCADGAKLERLVFLDCRFVAPETAEIIKRIETTVASTDLEQVDRSPQKIGEELEAGERALQQNVNPDCVYPPPPKNRIGLRNCRIATELRLECLTPQPFGDRPGMLIVDAFAASVGTNVIVRNTTLRAPRGESSATLPGPRYALDLSTAHVGSDVRLNPCVVLEGGLKMRDARIGGSLWAAGLEVTDGEDPLSREVIKKGRNGPRQALSLETTSIQGNLMLDIDDNTLQQAAENFRQHRREESGDKEGEKLDLVKFVMPYHFRSKGEISILNATVGGDLYFSRGNILGNLTMSNLTVRGSVQTKQLMSDVIVILQVEEKSPPRPLVVEGTIWLSNCHIGGDCTLEVQTNRIVVIGGVLSGDATFMGGVTIFNGQGVSVAGNLIIACRGIVDCNLSGAKVGGTLNFAYAGFKEFRPRPRAVLRSKELICYPCFYLTEVLVPVMGEEGEIREGIVSFLTTSQRPKIGVAYKPILLNGQAEKLYRLNSGNRTVIKRDGSEKQLRGDSPLTLSDAEKAREYLRLFCAFVWGDLGSFSLLTDPQDLPKGNVPNQELLKIPCTAIQNSPQTVWELKAYVRYGNRAYEAAFHLTGAGRAQIVGDDLIGEYEGADSEKLSTFESPYRFPPQAAALNPYRSDFQGWQNVSDGEKDIADFEKEASGWQTPLNHQATIDLSSASCKMLSDRMAEVWPKPGNMKLEEFDYRTIQVLPGSKRQQGFENRLKWIRSGIAGPEHLLTAVGYFTLTLVVVLFLLWESFRFALHWTERKGSLFAPNAHLGFRFLLISLSLGALLLAVLWLMFVRKKKWATAEFRAQPYAHLAQVLRERGDDDLARKVEAEKMWQEAVESSRFFVLRQARDDFVVAPLRRHV